MKTPIIHALTVAGLLVLSGCGGSGGLSGSESSAGTVGVFLTDSFRDDYEHVWVRIYKVEMRDSEGIFRSAYESTEGALQDLKSLRDEWGGKFAHLANASMPPGTYDQVRVTLKDEIGLIRKGETKGELKHFTKTILDAGDAVITFDLNPPLVSPSEENKIIIDFDLEKFSLDNEGNVVPVLRQGDDTGFENPERHEAQEYHGIVTSLESGFFLLDLVESGLIKVLYDDAALLSEEVPAESSQEQNIPLKNGQSVEIEGKYDPTRNSVLATAIRVSEIEKPAGGVELSGIAQSVDTQTNALILTKLQNPRGFTPKETTVKVIWDDKTLMRRGNEIVKGDSLSENTVLKVVGIYDEKTNTIHATYVFIKTNTLNNKDGLSMNMEPCDRTDEEWKKLLTPEQYRILREKGTEPAFTGKFWNNKEKGVYICAGCGEELFASETKFDSGTGWPSFWDVLDSGKVELREDLSHGMRRTEVVCAKCGGHLGHLFSDGPQPTGKRYCINSASLDFKKKEDKP
ncbi:MAG TPA: peptide-methionine (R)-S-oxide reductase MsrB [Fimbriimonadales bacterium]|nr:peptide-methionine (R)-S-oxide reductase MsrB [Fimbriimonadales bacterium]